MATENEILTRIEKLQESKDYADEVEAALYQVEIDKLWAQLEQLDKEKKHGD